MDLQCEGSRNYLNALHLAVENDEEAKHNVGKAHGWTKYGTVNICIGRQASLYMYRCTKI